MFSAALNVGTRLKDWKMNPIRSRLARRQIRLAQRRELEIAQEDLPRCRPVETRQAVKQSRLPRSRWAHYRREPAPCELDRYPVDRMHDRVVLAVYPDEVFRLYRRRLCALRFAPPSGHRHDHRCLDPDRLSHLNLSR